MCENRCGKRYGSCPDGYICSRISKKNGVCEKKPSTKKQVIEVEEEEEVVSNNYTEDVPH